jgi:hypothetical protein
MGYHVLATAVAKEALLLIKGLAMCLSIISTIEINCYGLSPIQLFKRHQPPNIPFGSGSASPDFFQAVLYFNIPMGASCSVNCS